MALGYHISTLLYCFNEQDEVLLMHRAKEPNLNTWSPCGGKLDIIRGESPFACACREAFEELQIRLTTKDLHLTGIVSECALQGSHWLMFLFEVKIPLRQLPPVHREGYFGFFSREQVTGLDLPATDRERLWPLFWEHRGGFFAAHCRHSVEGREWTLEESIPPLRLPSV